MELERGVLVSPTAEVPVVEGEIVTAIRELADRGWGSKAIARGVGHRAKHGAAVSAQPVVAGRAGPALGAAADRGRSARRRRFYEGEAEGNAVVVQQLLRDAGRAVSVRTVAARGRAGPRRRSGRADVATVRVETAPGAQMQIDFGEKRVTIAGTAVTVFLLVAVLSYSRRTFVKAFLHERQDDWREGIAAAFLHFGGVVLDGARRQCPRAGARARSGDRHRDVPSRLPGLLSRLGRAAARLRAVSRAHQRQGRSPA